MTAHEFQIEDNIYVGGCVGRAVEITDTEIVVAGRYHYYDIEMETNPNLQIWEDWQIRYSIPEFAKAEWDEERKEWRAEKVPHIYGNGAIQSNEG
jgi:hypothetical protein